MITISQDDLWKGIIEDLFEDFLWYFYPDWTKETVDFNKPPEFLDKELDKIFPTLSQPKRYADKLVKVHTQTGKEQWILIHIEVQGYKDVHFPERMFQYFYRIRERWKRDILTLAIFTDDAPDYLPKSYQYQYQNTKVLYEFDTFKILEKTEAELNIPNNPFSVVMLTAKKALEKQANTDTQQLLWKISLVKALKAANYSSQKIGKILDFIRYYVKFNTEANLTSLNQSIDTIFKTRENMGIQEIILQKTLEQGLEQGVLKTKIKGIQKALQRGKLTLQEIAEDFEVSSEFVVKVQRGEVKL